MRVWTFQNAAAIRQALARGYFTGQHDHSGIEHGLNKFAPPRLLQADLALSYRWMRQRLAERLPAFSGDLPLWGLVYRPGEETESVLCGASRDYLVEFEIPWQTLSQQGLVYNQIMFDFLIPHRFNFAKAKATPCDCGTQCQNEYVRGQMESADDMFETRNHVRQRYGRRISIALDRVETKYLSEIEDWSDVQERENPIAFTHPLTGSDATEEFLNPVEHSQDEFRYYVNYLYKIGVTDYPA